MKNERHFHPKIDAMAEVWQSYERSEKWKRRCVILLTQYILMNSTYHTFRTTIMAGKLGPRLVFTNKCKVVNKVTKIISDYRDITCKDKAIPHTGLLHSQKVPEGSDAQISRQSAKEDGKVVRFTHRSPLPYRKYSWYSFMLQGESNPEP